jgi:hypothetical protein
MPWVGTCKSIWCAVVSDAHSWCCRREKWRWRIRSSMRTLSWLHQPVQTSPISRSEKAT